MRFTLSVVITLFLLITLVHAVPVVPNEAIVMGTVLEYDTSSSKPSDSSTEQVLSKFVIAIDEVKDVKGYPNFLKGKVGQSITAFSKEKPTPELIGKKIRATVEYTGDEKGGLFWIKQVEIIRE